MATGRKAQSLNVWVSVAVMLGLLVAVNLISHKHFKRFDFTKARRHSLSEQSRKVARELKKDTSILVFTKDRGAADKGLLDQYRAESPRIRYEFVDPDRQPLKAKQYGVSSFGTTVVVVSGDTTEKAYRFDEKEITSALLRAAMPGTKKVVFTKGHGEKDPDAYDGSGVNVLKRALEEERYTVSSVSLATEKIPDDCDVLVIAGPKYDFLPQEIAVLRDYLNNGGRLLLLLDPGALPNLVAFCRDAAGIEVGANFVVDPASRLMDAGIPTIDDYEDHEITKDLKNVITVMSFVRSVEPASSPPSGVTVHGLMRTSSRSFLMPGSKPPASGRVRLEGKQTRAVTVACASEVDVTSTDTSAAVERKGRVVVFGDSDFAGDRLIAYGGGNGDLVLNSVGWLADRLVLVSVRSKEQDSQPLVLTGRQGRIVMLVGLAGIPLGIMTLGVGVLLRRRLRT